MCTGTSKYCFKIVAVTEAMVECIASIANLINMAKYERMTGTEEWEAHLSHDDH